MAIRHSGNTIIIRRCLTPKWKWIQKSDYIPNLPGDGNRRRGQKSESEREGEAKSANECKLRLEIINNDNNDMTKSY